MNIKILSGMLDWLILAMGMPDTCSFTINIDECMQNEKRKLLDTENCDANKAGSGLVDSLSGA